MNATDKLQKFIDDSDTFPGFDVDNAIKLLRASDYPKVASRLSLKYKRTQVFLSILMEDVKDYASATKFLRNLPNDQVCATKKSNQLYPKRFRSVNSSNLMEALC
uniref:Uncharacterized protein n=1 Tax=Acrobeloides nanus TaxID=290746 RepID=A0A914DFW0_9BILA